MKDNASAASLLTEVLHENHTVHPPLAGGRYPGDVDEGAA